MGDVAPEAPALPDWGDDPAVFEAHLRPLMPRLFRFCMSLVGQRAEAEDLLQESMLRAFVRRDRFKGTGTLLGWMFAVIRNQHADMWRRTQRRRGLWDSAVSVASDVIEWLRPSAPGIEVPARSVPRFILCTIRMSPGASVSNTAVAFG